MATNDKITLAEETKKQVQIFETQLSNYERQIAQLIEQKGVSKQEFMVTLLNAVKRNTDLLKCDRKTLFDAILTSAELGLMPNTPFGLSWILPYNISQKDENGKWQKIKAAQYQTGYQGWLELLYRQQAVKMVTSEIVYDGDEFEEKKGLNPDLVHVPCKPSERGNRRAAYAIVWLVDSPHPIWAVVYKEDIDKIKKISQSASNENSPWKNEDKDPFAWQWRKTAIKQVAKMMPKTREIQIAVKSDDAVEMGDHTEITEDGQFTVIENEERKAHENLENHKAKSQKVQNDAKEKYIPKKEEKKDDPVEKFENEGKDKKDEKPPKEERDYTEEAKKIIGKLEVIGITPKRVLSKYGFKNADQFDEESFADLKSSHEGIVDKGFSHKEMFPLIDE